MGPGSLIKYFLQDYDPPTDSRDAVFFAIRGGGDGFAAQKEGTRSGRVSGKYRLGSSLHAPCECRMRVTARQRNKYIN